MAVIGARPAATGWFGGRGSRLSRRPRPAAARRGRRSATPGRLVPQLDIRPLLVLIAVAAALALFYLSQSTHVAATGYQIDTLETALADRRAEQQHLIWEIGHARSPAAITKHARTQLHLIVLDDEAVTFVPTASQPPD